MICGKRSFRGDSMASEEEMNRMASELQLQQAKGEAIRQQMQQMQSSLMEIGAAIDTIENISKAKGDALVPIGAGAYLSCPKPNPDKVVLNAGANVLVQKKPDEAVKILKDRQKKIADAMNTMQKEMGVVVREIEALTNAASSYAAEEERTNVRPPKE